jgi:hypothetical protein
MFEFLFKVAAVVMFVFTLVAALRYGALFNELWTVWLASGLLATSFALFFAPWVDTQFNAARAYRRPVPAPKAEEGAHNA